MEVLFPSILMMHFAVKSFSLWEIKNDILIMFPRYTVNISVKHLVQDLIRWVWRFLSEPERETIQLLLLLNVNVFWVLPSFMTENWTSSGTKRDIWGCFLDDWSAWNFEHYITLRLCCVSWLQTNLPLVNKTTWLQFNCISRATACLLSHVWSSASTQFVLSSY